MKQIYNTQNTIKEMVKVREMAGKCLLPILSRFCLVSLILMTVGIGQAWGANPIYNNGYWYSVYDATPYSKSTVSGVTLHTYSNAFVPNAGTFAFESKLPGNDQSGKQSSNSDPHDYGVEAYNINFGGQSVEVAINATVTGVDKSGRGTFLSPYKYTFNYTYNYQPVQGSGLNTESTSFDAKYEYKLKNTLRTVYIQNVKVPVGRHIRLVDPNNAAGTTSITNVSLPATAYGNTSTAYHIDLRSFYVESTSIKYESSNSEFHFGTGSTIANGKASITKTVKANSCAFIGGTANCASTASSLGNPDNQEVDVYFTPSSNKNGSSSATITIYDGTTARATITLTAKVIPTYYFKATSVATNGSQTLDIAVKASFTEGSYAGASQTVSQTATAADVASLTKKAYFYAPASSGDYQFQGWYTTADCSGTRVSTDNTISYDITSSAVSTTTATEKKYYALYLPIITAEFTGSDQTLKVDGTYTGIGYTRTSAAIASANSADKFWYEIIIDSKTSVTAGSTDANKVISYDPTTKTVTAINAGTARLVFHQEATGYYVDVDKTYTFTVEKYATSIGGGTPYNLKVDSVKAITNYSVSNISKNVPDSGATNHSFYYTIAHTLPANKNVVGSTHPNEVIGYNASSHTITAYNAGTAVLTIAQKETYKYTGDTMVFNVNVTKRPNSLNCKFDGNSGWTKTLNFDEYTNVVFSSNHTITKINVDINDGDSIAFYDKKTGKITAYSLVGDALWNVSQAENYKYFAADTKICKVSVETKACPTCYVFEKYTDLNAIEQLTVTVEKVGTVSWDEDGVANKLTYDMMQNGAGNNAMLSTRVSNAWTTAEAIGVDYELIASGYHGLSKDLNAHTTALKFEKKNSDNPFIKNIRVSRETWFKIEDLDGNKLSSLKLKKNKTGGNTTTAKFRVNFSTCDSVVKIASNNQKISVDITSISLDKNKGGSGVYDITITYSSDKVEMINAVISAYTRYEQASLNIHAETEREEQEIEWNSDFPGKTVTLPVTFTSDNAATASSHLPVTYSTTTPNIILISEEQDAFKVIALGQNATLIANQVGNEQYQPVSDTLIINSTNKKIQTIVWNQNYTRNLKPDSVCDLTAQVYITDLLEGTHELSAERTALIQYSCAENDTVIFIDNTTKKMRILRYGETTVTARVAGDGDNYEVAVPVTKTVKVRKLSEGDCAGDDPIYVQSDTIDIFYLEKNWANLGSFGTTLSRPAVPKTIRIDLTKGVPDSLSFKVHAVPYKVPYVGTKEYMKGYVTVLESSDNGIHWSDTLIRVNPASNQTKSCIIPLQRTTNMVMFYRPEGGEGHHYIEEAIVTRKQFIEAEDTIKLGYVAAGSVRNDEININYSDARKDFDVTKGVANSKNKLILGDDKIYVSCGETGRQKLGFQFRPMEVGDWKDTVTITDPKTNKSATVIMMADITQGSQEIVWKHPIKLSFGDTIFLNATATSELPVEYEIISDENKIAKVQGDTIVLISGLGDVTIRATQSGNVSFTAAEPVEKTFTIKNDEIVFVGNGSWSDASNWQAGQKPGNGDDVKVTGQLVISDEREVNSLTIVGNGSITTIDHGKLIVNGDSKEAGADGYGDVRVKEGSELILRGTLQVKDFIIESNLGVLNGENSSGQVENPNKLNINGDAYIDITLAPAEGFNENLWYGFALPFEVDAVNGVYRYENGEVKKGTYMKDYAIASFSSIADYNGKKPWSYHKGTLEAGVFYMLTIDGDFNVYRFKKKEAASKQGSSIISLTTCGDGAAANWNAVGNSTLSYVDASFTGDYLLVYKNGHSAYMPVRKDEATFVVGCPFFVQATQNESMTLTQADNSKSAFYAPRRATAATETSYQVQIAADGERFSDQIFVSAAEDALNSYEIGRDLQKAGIGTKSAQIWINAYNEQLAVNEAELVDGQAMYNLTLFAPKSGEYTLSLENAGHDGNLFLTYHGMVIWNLSYGAYIAQLEEGNNAGYGLLLKPNAHQVTTTVESAESTENVQKFIMNGQLFILNNGTLYDGNGKKVQ